MDITNNNKKEDSNDNIINEKSNSDNEKILEQIFRISKDDTEKYLPFLLEDSCQIIKKIFSEYPTSNNCNNIREMILNKTNLISRIKEIIGNSYEILYIIFDYLSQHNISPFSYFIDLYIDYITLYEKESSKQNKKVIIDKIKNIFSWFISCGLLNKKVIDYIYQKIALFQLEKKLSKNIFNDILPLLEIIYGKYYDISIKNSFVGKKYIYLYDKDKSCINTIISNNNISIKNGFSITLWFYLNDYEFTKSNLCEIKINYNQQINFTLSEKFDKYDIGIEFNNEILNEKDNKIFDIKPKIWTQIKIDFSSTEISIYLFQSNKIEEQSKLTFSDNKKYLISKNNESNNENINVIENCNFDNFNITEIVFFKNYCGIIGTILFFNIFKEGDNTPINSLYGIENKKLDEFIQDKKIFKIYFIFAPSLYLYDCNQVIDSANNCIAELPIRPCQEGKDILNLNSIVNYHNYSKNIFYLGGCYNLLPLMEIFYKFSLEKNENENEIAYLKDMLNNIFKILEVIFVKKKKNALLPLQKEKSFYESLRLFMEKIDKIFYYDNEGLLKILLNIANYYNELLKQKIITIKESSAFFLNILFNPEIIIKFNLSLQEKLINTISDYSVVIHIDSINKLLLLLSKEYKNEEIEKNKYFKTLFKYINTIFESANDSQRESLFLLYKNKENNYSKDIALSDNMFIHIMNVFILYIEFGIKKEDIKIKRKQTINNFLYSNNNFIEHLLYYLSKTNIHVKKVIINFLRILTQTYGDILDLYFSKEKKNQNKINKEEFYAFIKENIAPNYINENIEIFNDINNKKEESNNKNIKNDEQKKDEIGKKEDNNNNIENNNNKEENNKKTEKENETKDKKEEEKKENEIKGEKEEEKKEEKKEDETKGETEEEKKEEKKEDEAKGETEGEKKENETKSKIGEEKNEDETKDEKEEEKKENEIKDKKEEENKTDKEKKKNIEKMNNIKEKNDNKNKILKKKSFKEKELTEEEKLIIQNTKCEISLVLYNWLANLVIEKESMKNQKLDESIQHVIDYIVKLISFSKEYEVIFRTLLVLLNQKDKSTSGNKDYDAIYYKLLQYLSKNNLFIQLLIELLINTYILKNIKEDKDHEIFVVISKSKGNEEQIRKAKEKYINDIYNYSKELLLDIYFDQRNRNKGDIIIEMYLIILKMSKGSENIIDDNKKDLIFKFLKIFFIDICNINQITSLNDLINVFTLFMEYSFLLKTSDNFMQGVYDSINQNFTNCIPDFLVSGLYHPKESDWIGYDVYSVIYNIFKKILSIDKIFESLNLIYHIKNNNTNTNFDKKKDILVYDINLVNSLINDVIYNKKKLNLKTNIKVLIYSYKDGGYDNHFPLMNIISLYYSLCLYLNYSNFIVNTKINLMSLLNDIQNYIIYLICVSLIINEKDDLLSKKYDEVQSLIYKNLFFNIKNLINRLSDEENNPKYLQILHNIIIFLSVINDINQKELKKDKEGGFLKVFKMVININRTAPVMLINFLTQNMKDLFNDSNFKFFIDNRIGKEKAQLLINESIGREDIPNPSVELFKISFFKSIVKKRYEGLQKKSKLLIIGGNEFNSAMKNYIKIIEKINKIENNFHYDEIQIKKEEIYKIKKYRKIKEDLYSFNNSYSNLQIFYNLNKNENENENENEKENGNKYSLKYKISNFLCKDMTRKLLKPIIDINYYLPNFRKFKYENSSIYLHENNQVYSVDLEIFKSGGNPPVSPDNKKEFDKKKYYIEKNVCYIKTMNHIKGKIFHLINLDDKCLNFCMTKLPPTETLIKNYVDYDTANKSCFSSIFRNNLNKKDYDIYLKINFSDILFIFKRKYCFRDNSLEIYTSNHRSYYFKFENNERRDKFLEHLITILNKGSSLFSKSFKPIESINERSKSITLGYYKNIDNNSDYSTISNIKEIWKTNKISTLEYLMWINMYGNRSYRDISQFPVLPWIIDNYKTNTFKEIIDNENIRDFKTPMGMMSLNEKGKERAGGYIQNYTFMSLDLKESGIVDFESKEEDFSEDIVYNIDDNNNNNQKSDKKEKEKEKVEEESNTTPDSNSNNSNNANTKTIEKKNSIKKCYQKIPQFKYDINKLYTDVNVEYDHIPFCFGSHYSNSMYVSHFLGRLFPYALTMIEIQGTGFDCSERLFLCLDKTFLSSTEEKSDVRELIPEFYNIPEMFKNLNNLNFGEVNINNFNSSINYIKELKISNIDENKITVQDVLLPNWCKFNPYFFIIKKRELLESRSSKFDFNPWLDLIFGCSQRGAKSQAIGNLFSPYAYDGVINIRIKDEDILKDRAENEYQIRLFELGVNPTLVFSRNNVDKKQNMKQISDINKVDKPIPSINEFEGKIRFISNHGNDINSLIVFYKNYTIKKCFLDENRDINGNYKIKNWVSSYRDLNTLFKSTTSSKLIFKYMPKSNILLLSGYYNGNLFLINLDINSKLNINDINIMNKMNEEDQILLKNYGKGIITSLEISKDEKYIVFGNDKGTLVILENQGNKNNYKLLDIISSHTGYIINTVSINSDLNLFADCSYDNYIHIYTLPKCTKINSIFMGNNNIYMDYIFLSAQPMASIILYSNKSCEFKCYGINGHDLKIEQNDKQLLDECKFKHCTEPMVSPIIFTDSRFSDFLLYVFCNQFILLRKMPLMDIFLKINFDENESISLINISLNKENIYAVDNYNKRVYVINYKNKQLTPTNPAPK